MEGIAAEIRRLSVRTERGMKIACPRPCCNGAMVILDRGDFELVLICSMCSRERARSRVDEAGRRMAPVLKQETEKSHRLDEVERRLLSDTTVSKRDMCAVLGVARSTLDKRLEKNPLPGIIVRGQPHKWRFPLDDAERWMADWERTSVMKAQLSPIG